MRYARVLSALTTSVAIMTALLLGSCSGEPYERNENGITVRLNGKSDFPGQAIRLQVINDRIIRVSAVPSGEFPETASLMTIPQPDTKTEFTIEKGEGQITLGTSSLTAEVSLKTGEVRFTDRVGTLILSEQEGEAGASCRSWQ